MEVSCTSHMEIHWKKCGSPVGQSRKITKCKEILVKKKILMEKYSVCTIIIVFVYLSIFFFYKSIV